MGNSIAIEISKKVGIGSNLMSYVTFMIKINLFFFFKTKLFINLTFFYIQYFKYGKSYYKK